MENKDKIKKFEFFIKEEFVIKDMECGLDLTKSRSDEFVLGKTIEYIKENF
jgi:hypothetical protein